MNAPPSIPDVRDVEDFVAADPSADPIAVLHVITGVNVGGAERMLFKLVDNEQASSTPLRQDIVSLLPPGCVGREMQAAGARLHTLDMQAGIPSPSALLRLRRLIDSLNPDIVVGWMHHAFLAATLAGLGRDGPPVVWNVRHSLHDIKQEKPLTRVVLNLCAKLSGAPAAIVFNAAAARTQYDEFGFHNPHMKVIENGFDADRFQPKPNARTKLEEAFGLSSDAFVVASVARCHPMKDPKTLIEAVGKVARNNPNTRLLLIGDGYENPPADIQEAINAALPRDAAILSGHRSDLSDWMGGVDVFALSSAWGEGFPNVLGEALACGTPCVATDVGDSAAIIGAAGRIAQPGDPDAFANAISEIAAMSPAERRTLGRIGRDRVLQEYAIDRVVERYSELYRDILARKDSRRKSPRVAAGASV